MPDAVVAVSASRTCAWRVAHLAVGFISLDSRCSRGSFLWRSIREQELVGTYEPVFLCCTIRPYEVLDFCSDRPKQHAHPGKSRLPFVEMGREAIDPPSTSVDPLGRAGSTPFLLSRSQDWHVTQKYTK